MGLTQHIRKERIHAVHKSTSPKDPATQEMARFLVMKAGLDQYQQAVIQAAGNEDFQGMIRESTKGIDLANKLLARQTDGMVMIPPG